MLIVGITISPKNQIRSIEKTSLFRRSVRKFYTSAPQSISYKNSNHAIPLIAYIAPSKAMLP
jgi:hypothetical protein